MIMTRSDSLPHTHSLDPSTGLLLQVGDPTLSAMEIWGAEYQENCAFLVAPEVTMQHHHHNHDHNLDPNPHFPFYFP